MFVSCGSRVGRHRLQPSDRLIQQILPNGVNTFTFSILGLFTHLRITYSARSDVVATNDTLLMRFNGDTSSIYDTERLGASTTTVTGAEIIAGASLQAGIISGSTAASGNVGTGEIIIPDYRGTSFHKSPVSSNTFKQANTTGNTFIRSYGLSWRNTAAISSITILLGSGNFVAGSKFSLYGIL